MATSGESGTEPPSTSKTGRIVGPELPPTYASSTGARSTMGNRTLEPPSTSDHNDLEKILDEVVPNARFLHMIFSNPGLVRLISITKQVSRFDYEKWLNENFYLIAPFFGAEVRKGIVSIIVDNFKPIYRIHQIKPQSYRGDPLGDRLLGITRQMKAPSPESARTTETRTLPSESISTQETRTSPSQSRSTGQTKISSSDLVSEIVNCLRQLYLHEQPANAGEETLPNFEFSLDLQVFIYRLIREMLPPIRCYEVVLKSRSLELYKQTVKFSLGAEFTEYIKLNTFEMRQFLTLLMVSGDGDIAEASTCIDYCARLWPQDGQAMLMALTDALEIGAGNKQLPSGTKLYFHRSKTDGKVHFSVEGTNEAIIKISQQLGWIAAVFRLPSATGVLSSSEAAIIALPGTFQQFTFEQLKLKEYEDNEKICWRPLLRNFVVAHEYPVRERHDEIGLEIPFAAMVQLSRVLGLVDYEGGTVLKAASSILYPVALSMRPSGEQCGQWHLIHVEKEPVFETIKYAGLALLDRVSNRWLCKFEDLNRLSVVRTFLGCYKNITVHLATEDSFQSTIGPGATRDAQPKLELSGVNFGASLSKIVGLTATANFTLPQQIAIQLGPPPYEQAITYWSGRAAVLYDTLDRRAWMVPALTVILHMVHIFFQRFKEKSFLTIHGVPYARPRSDIAKETLFVLQQHSNQELYRTFDDKPYTLKEKVTEYCLLFDKLVAAKKPGNPNLSSPIIRWDFLEVVDSPIIHRKTPRSAKFESKWTALGHDVPVFYGTGFGDIIVPELSEQTLCKTWRTVPSSNDYLVATIRCLRTLDFSVYVDRRSTPIEKVESVFADCNHDDNDRSCHRARRHYSGSEMLMLYNHFDDGALIFGDKARQTFLLHKLKTWSPIRINGQANDIIR